MGSTTVTPTFTPIAICGYSCRLPGTATSPEELWKMCEQGRGAWSKIPGDRFSQDAFNHPVQGEPGTTTVQGGHFLEQDVYAFDASFFNMSVETATSMDPVIRLQLETVFEGLEHAGLTLDKVAGTRTSVFAAAFHRDYHDSMTRNTDHLPRYMLTGTGTAMLSNRISHFFDLRGPSLTVDTGCSSSLSSLHMACRSLQSGDSEMAVVTGCNLMLNPDPFISMSGIGLLSPSGRSYAFDERAEGYGRGEGAVTIILKKLSRAKTDGDTIHGIIRGSANNQDGKTTTITSPSQDAQEQLIRECYAAAGLDPSLTPLVECHGTGTKVGDLCEASAIRNALDTADSRPSNTSPPLYLSSTKSHIGHLEAASGLASIVKVLKAFQHDSIPPNHDFVHPNPAIQWDNWRLAVVGAGVGGPVPWPSGYPKRASINSFGYGGANAHVILDAPETEESHKNGNTEAASNSTNNGSSSSSNLFLLCANDEKTCSSALSRFSTYIDSLSFADPRNEAESLSALAYKLAHQRTHFKWRAAVHASSRVELVESIRAAKPTRILTNSKSSPPSIGFVFTGQGAQWAGMGKELIDAYPVFREALQQTDICLADLGASWSVIEELMRDSTSSKLDNAEIGMPVCCALQIALVVLLKSWGIVPSAVTGHSSGESAAAFAVGAIDMRSALAVQYYRGLLTAAAARKTDGEVRPGGMLAVGLSPEDAQGYIDTTVSAGNKVVIGCFNSPSSVTLSGDEDGILELEQILKERGVFVRRLQVQTAFHSHHMDSDLAKYRELLEKAFSKTPEDSSLTAPLASSVTGTWLTRAHEFGPEHWVRYMRQPVLFTEASTLLCSDKVYNSRKTADGVNGSGGCTSTSTGAKKAVDVLIEIGPHSALSSPLRQTLQSLKIPDITYTSVLKRSENAVDTAHSLAGLLWTRGIQVDFTTIAPKPKDTTLLRHIDPPSYPWNHYARFVIEDPVEIAFRHRAHPKNSLLGAMEPQSNPNAPAWRRTCQLDAGSWPSELVIDGLPRYPTTFLLSMVVEAARLVSNSEGKTPSLRLENIRFPNLPETFLIISGSKNNNTVVLRTSLHELPQRDAVQSDIGSATMELVRSFQVHAIQHPNRWTLLCQGAMTLFQPPTETDSPNLSTSNGVSTGKERTKLIPIRPGALDINNKFDIPEPSSVQLELSQKSAVLHLQGNWSPEDLHSDSEHDSRSKTLFLKSSPRLASALQAAVGFKNIIHISGKQTSITSIEKMTITPETIASGETSKPSPFYTATVQQMNGNLSVTWNQIQHNNLNTIPVSSEKSMTLDGITFQSVAVARSHVQSANNNNTIYQSILVPSLSLPSSNLITTTLNQLIPRHTLSPNERQVLADLNQICLYYFSEALKSLRANPPRRLLGHFASYVQFIKSVVEPHPSTPTSPQKQQQQQIHVSPAEFPQLKSRVQKSSINGQLVTRVGDNLVPLIKGEQDALEVMMADGLLHRYYEQGLRWTRSYEQLKALVRLLVLENPRMEILEIGAGTGGATCSVLEAIDSSSSSEQGGIHVNCEKYTYTDISAGFFLKAREKFAKFVEAGIMEFKKLDCEKDLNSQAGWSGFNSGKSPEGYDLIVASQCLHATSNMRRTMSNVRKLLKPGGRIVMVETTRDSLDIQLFASCFRGWWLSEEPERKWSPSLSLGLWQSVLVDSGFTGVDFAVRDCEEEEFWAMQVILSTATDAAADMELAEHGAEVVVNGGDAYGETVQIVDARAVPDLVPARAIRDELMKRGGVQLGSPQISERALTMRDLVGRQKTDGDKPSHLLLIVDDSSDWLASPEMETLVATLNKRPSDCATIVVKVGSGSDGLGHHIRTLLSVDKKPVVWINVDTERNPLDDTDTIQTISNIFRACVHSGHHPMDVEYLLINSRLVVPRVSPFTPEIFGSTTSDNGLRPDQHYLVRGRSASLLMAITTLLVSFGARNVVLMASHSIPDLSRTELETFLEKFSSSPETGVDIQMHWDSQADNTYSNGNFAGVIDFGDIDVNVDLGDRGTSDMESAVPNATGSRETGTDFHITFIPLNGLSPGAVVPTTRATSSSGESQTTIYTGPIIGTAPITDNIPDSGVRGHVELHTILLMLADLVRPSSPKHSPRTFYLGVPWSLTTAEQNNLFVNNPYTSRIFKSLSPRRTMTNPDVLDGSTKTLQNGHVGLNHEQVLDKSTISRKIAGYIAEMFMFPDPSEVDTAGPLNQYIDSLTASQLRGWLATNFPGHKGSELTGRDIAESGSIYELAGKVVASLGAA